jgi:2-keto-3-deoxy-L-rhamnonate aldolase RhmA
MQPAKLLREKISSRQVTTGILITHHLWPELIEVVRRAGLDYVIIDMEHGSATTEVIAAVCSIGRQVGFPVLIRPQANDYATVRLAIDLGACGFLLASVETTAQMDEVRDAIYLPPRGRRRPGGHSNRWIPEHTYSFWKGEVEDHFIVLPQIETKLGLRNMAEIAAHEITTAIAAGPYDLSAELGVCGKMDDPKLREALLSIRAAGHAAGKEMWMIGSAGKLTQDGYRFICIGEPTWLLEAALRERVEQANQNAK